MLIHSASFSPPALRQCCHRGLARVSICDEASNGLDTRNEEPLIHCKDVILPSGSVIGARWRGTHGRRSYYHSPALSHARARADLEPPPMKGSQSFRVLRIVRLAA